MSVIIAPLVNSGALRIFKRAMKLSRMVWILFFFTLTACGGAHLDDESVPFSSSANSSGGSSSISDYSLSSSVESDTFSSSSSTSTSSARSINSSTSSNYSRSSLSSSAGSSSERSSSSVAFTEVQISGRVSYDYVPVHKTLGLNYNATVAKAVPFAKINAIDLQGMVLNSTQTSHNGHYQITVPSERQVKIQVEALSFNESPAQWQIRVEDNTSGNGLYLLEGPLGDSGTENSVRDLHAASGWTGNGYTEPRAAAPFAIIDSAYQGVLKLLQIDANLSLSPSIFRWSVNNTVATGDIAAGDIGTSYYDGEAVYLLGQADIDTDEYDAHVIAHEWSHFVELQLGKRIDSLGGGHTNHDKLDMRVAYSEGLANALAAYVLADPDYRDTFSVSQSVSDGFDVSQRNVHNAGWYNEASIQAILYHFSKAGAFEAVYSVISDHLYVTSPAFASIFSFSDTVGKLYPDKFPVLDSLMEEQNIFGRGLYGEGEVNDGGVYNALPLYIDLAADGAWVTACSTKIHGEENKLGVHRFLKVEIVNDGSYRLLVESIGDRPEPTDPDVKVLGSLNEIQGISSIENAEVLDLNLSAGITYVVSVNDYAEHTDTQQLDYQPACFNVSLTPQ